MTDHNPNICKKCDASCNLINESTRNYVKSLFDSLEGTHAQKHMPAPAILLIAMNAVVEALGVSLGVEMEHFAEGHTGSKAEGQKQIDAMTKAVIESSFQILEENLPIKIAATSAVKAGDVSKVMSYVDGLEAKNNGKAKH
jgi:cytochrome b